MATAKQIAARKKFAERARSGELAKMRKNATERNPAKTVSQEISQQMRKGKPQKQAVAIALEMERAGKVKRNTATRAPARSRTKLVSNGREKNPIHGYTVMCGRSGRVLGYADTLPMAKAMATSIANDRNMQVKIEKN